MEWPENRILISDWTTYFLICTPTPTFEPVPFRSLSVIEGEYDGDREPKGGEYDGDGEGKCEGE